MERKVMHSISGDWGPLGRYRTLDAWQTSCGKTAKEVSGNACYPSVFVDCPECLTALEKGAWDR